MNVIPESVMECVFVHVCVCVCAAAAFGVGIDHSNVPGSLPVYSVSPGVSLWPSSAEQSVEEVQHNTQQHIG